MTAFRSYMALSTGLHKPSVFRPQFDVAWPETPVETINFAQVTRSLLITSRNDNGEETPIAIAYIKPGQRVAFAYLGDLVELN